jgi:hypothetical protein
MTTFDWDGFELPMIQRCAVNAIDPAGLSQLVPWKFPIIFSSVKCNNCSDLPLWVRNRISEKTLRLSHQIILKLRE